MNEVELTTCIQRVRQFCKSDVEYRSPVNLFANCAWAKDLRGLLGLALKTRRRTERTLINDLCELGVQYALSTLGQPATVRGSLIPARALRGLDRPLQRQL